METLDAPDGIVVVGAGIAGLWTALRLAPRKVLCLTAGILGAGSSSWAQGGIAAAVGPDDSPEEHFKDTINAGAGLTDLEAARALTTEGVEALHDLAAAGVPFDRCPDGSFVLGREAAHHRDRIAHVGGDEAGAAIMRTLVNAAQSASHLSVREKTVAERIVTDDAGVAGIVVWDTGAQKSLFCRARTVVLATGGAGGLFRVTTNPLYNQGSGLSLAAEAGATLRDLEFIQFHPTGLHVDRDPAPLATEAIRGAGGILVTSSGERFMTSLHPDAELAPRDVVARGVAKAIRDHGGAFLDATKALGRDFPERFPTVYEAARSAGYDPASDLLPVAPAAHYHMGGVLTDLDGRSDVPGLLAVGECASSGVHGANRLASNSLLEAVVFGSRAACSARDERRPAPPVAPPMPESLTHAPPQGLGEIRSLMAENVGLLRDANGLSGLMGALRTQPISSVGERLAVLAASGIAQAALARQESRGAHFRTDYPEAEGKARHSLSRLGPEGWSTHFKEAGR